MLAVSTLHFYYYKIYTYSCLSNCMWPVIVTFIVRQKAINCFCGLWYGNSNALPYVTRVEIWEHTKCLTFFYYS